MNSVLYIKIERNVKLTSPTVMLKDIAKLTCSNQELVYKLKPLKVYTFQTSSSGKKKKKQIAVFSILKIIELIGKEYPTLEIQNIGESDFVLEYIPEEEAKWIGYIKAVCIFILVFFGSAFSIMTFNNDVGVSNLFAKFYEQVMGEQSSGFTILEITYSLGLGIGIVVFFNHVGKKRVTSDPTPMQVEMRLYEQDVDTTFIENCSRKGTSIDVD